MVKDPVSFFHLIIQDDYSSSGYQHRPEERGEEEHFKDSFQKLHRPLSVIAHWPDLGHVAAPGHKDEKYSLYSRWL